MKSKYNIDRSEKGKLKRTYQGVVFDSEMEMLYLKEVIEPKIKLGIISRYERQVTYELLPAFTYQGQKFAAVKYKSDFNILYTDGTEEVIDIKGMSKPMDILKRKMLLSRYPKINYKWVTRSIIDGGWVDFDIVKKNRAKRKKNKEIEDGK